MTKLSYGDLRVFAVEFFLKQRQNSSYFKLNPSNSMKVVTELSFLLDRDSQKGHSQEFQMFNTGDGQKAKNGLNGTLAYLSVATPIHRNNCT